MGVAAATDAPAAEVTADGALTSRVAAPPLAEASWPPALVVAPLAFAAAALALARRLRGSIDHVRRRARVFPTVWCLFLRIMDINSP